MRKTPSYIPKDCGETALENKGLTWRSTGWGNKRRKEALKQFTTGWVNYYKLADMKCLMIETDEWYRSDIKIF